MPLSFEEIENMAKAMSFSCATLASLSTNRSTTKCCWINLMIIIPSVASSLEQLCDFFDCIATPLTATNDRMMKTLHMQSYWTFSFLLCWKKVHHNPSSVTKFFKIVCAIQCCWIFMAPKKYSCLSDCWQHWNVLATRQHMMWPLSFVRKVLHRTIDRLWLPLIGS